MLKLRKRGNARKPQLPEKVRIYAIGDIHGCADILQVVFSAIDHDLESIGACRAIHVFLGDYIDRGPDSNRTIDLLIERGLRHESVFLRGNHEAVLMATLADPTFLQDWRHMGGFQTLLSYGLLPSLNPTLVEQRKLVQDLALVLPRHHVVFFNSLRSSYVCGDFFFVHAGIRPGITLAEQSERDLLWIRDDFLQSRDQFEKYIVHGHSPIPDPDIRSNRANIDTGAYATGKLTVLSIQDSELRIL